MNRLTNKFWYSEHYLPDHKIDASRFDCYDKLGQLEDIEDELGIDLITLFKALKQKHVFHKENVKIEVLGIHIKSGELYLYGFVEDTTHAVFLSLKEHRNTWGLTREELKEAI